MKLIIETDQETIEDCKMLFVEGVSNNAEYAVANGKPYEEQPKGSWVDSGTTADGYAVFRCSVCGRQIATYTPLLNRFPFCHCGADMRGDK